MARFKVGDVCELIQDSLYCPEIKAGIECTVVRLSSQHAGQISVDVHGFPPPGSDSWACPPEKLRLKRPPSWDKFIFDTSNIDEEAHV